LLVISVVIILFALLQVKAVQTFIAQKALTRISSDLESQISIDAIKITSLRDFNIDNLLVVDHDNDTILAIENLLVSLNRFKRKKNQLFFNAILVENGHFNMEKKEGDSIFNFQYIIDYFSGSPDTELSDSIGNVKPGLNIRCKIIKLNNFTYSLFDGTKVQRKTEPYKVDFSDLYVNNLAAKIVDFELKESKITANVRDISLLEKSGFLLERFATYFELDDNELIGNNTNFKTNNSELTLDLKFSYHGYHGFNSFIDSVRIQSVIKPSDLYIPDIAFFAPELIEMDNDIRLAGKISGSISNLRAKDFFFMFGENTSFFGNVSSSGLPVVEETFVDFFVKEFTTSVIDLQNFELPGIQDNTIGIPDELIKFGKLKIKGHFTGFYNDFVSYANFYSDLGNIYTDISLRDNPDENRIEYNGFIKANRFDFGSFLNIEEYFGTLNLAADIEGYGFDETSANITMDGVIDSLEFINYPYNQIVLAGNYQNKEFTGQVIINDTVLDLDFTGKIDFSDSLPAFDFVTDIKKADLFRLGLVENDSVSVFKSYIESEFFGNSPDNARGNVLLNNTSYSCSVGNYFMDNLNLSMGVDTNNNNSITLASDIIDASMTGQFMLSSVVDNLGLSLKKHLSFIEVDSSYIRELAYKGNYQFDVSLKRTDELSDIFYPELQIAPLSYIYGEVNSNEQTSILNMVSPSIEYFGVKLFDWSLLIQNNESGIDVSAVAEKVILREADKKDTLELGLDRFKIFAGIIHDSISVDLGWDDILKRDRNKGNIGVSLNTADYPAIRGSITNAECLINDTLWRIDEKNSFYLIQSI